MAIQSIKEKITISDNYIDQYGAVDWINLEPSETASILAELEDWNKHLQAEPEVLSRLRAFEEVAGVAGGVAEKRPDLARKRSGPSL